MDPIVLVICTDTLCDSVAEEVKTSDIPGCYDFPSLTSRKRTKNSLLHQEDPTIQYLYNLVSNFHEKRLEDQHVKDVLAQVLETQEYEHNKNLEPIDQDSFYEAIANAIKNLKS